MRTCKDFLKELRDEIGRSQDRRTTYIKYKLMFNVSLLGIGSASIINSSTNKLMISSLLYIVPLVGLVFDLYIFGEDFGVKRAGAFIKNSGEAAFTETLWEKFVEKNRDWYSYVANPVSSLLIVAGATFGILKSKPNLILFTLWLLVSIFFASFGFFYIIIQKIMASSYDRKIELLKEELNNSAKK